MKNIVLNDCHYEVIENYKNVFNLEELTDKFTDYFETFDYVLGDYSYGKLRLKGFYNKNNKELQEYNDYEKVHEYFKEYCSYNCGYYVIKKL